MEVDPSFGVQCFVLQVVFSDAQVGERTGNGIGGGFAEDGVSASVVGAFAGFEHEWESELVGGVVDGLDGGDVGVRWEGNFVFGEIFLYWCLIC